MTIGQLKEATCSKLVNAEKFFTHIEETFQRFKIITPIQQLCFLAQVGHESGGLYYTEEIASGDAYEGRLRLGNTQKGDGRKFKGRGLIQITGRANYTSLSNELQINCVDEPTLLGAKNVSLCTEIQLKNAALCAGWFWNKQKLNSLADKIDLKKAIDVGNNSIQFIAITKKNQRRNKWTS